MKTQGSVHIDKTNSAFQPSMLTPRRGKKRLSNAVEIYRAFRSLDGNVYSAFFSLSYSFPVSSRFNFVSVHRLLRRFLGPLYPTSLPSLLHLLRQQVAPHAKHLRAHPGREPVHLSRVLLYLPRVQQDLEPPGLRRQLEQPLPLVLGQGALLRQRPRRVLGLALLLPCGDLGLLATQLPLIVLVVVELRVVGFNGVEEEVRGFFEERVEGEG